MIRRRQNADPIVARPTIGQMAPAVELKTLEGDAWSLAAHRGQTVVLIFHRHAH